MKYCGALKIMADSDCLICGGTGWALVERGQVTGVKVCGCSMVSTAPRPALNVDSEETFDRLLSIIGELGQLNFFPGDDDARAGLVRLVGKMASSIDDVRRLVDEMNNLYNDWPGPAEMRVVFCTLVGRPRDGIERSHSSVFPDGVVPGTIAAGVFPQLKRLGGPASTDKLLDAGITELAKSRRLEAPPPVKAPRRDGMAPEERARWQAQIDAAMAERDRLRREELQRQVEGLLDGREQKAG